MKTFLSFLIWGLNLLFVRVIFGDFKAPSLFSFFVELQSWGREDAAGT